MMIEIIILMGFTHIREYLNVLSIEGIKNTNESYLQWKSSLFEIYYYILYIQIILHNILRSQDKYTLGQTLLSPCGQYYFLKFI